MTPYPSARPRILQGTILYTALAVVSIVGFVLLLLLALSGGDTYVVPMAFGLVVGLLAGFQGIQYWRDLRVAPQSLTGQVSRRWRRTNFFFWHSYYVRVGGRVFEVDPVVYMDLQDGDTVAVRYYPHTDTVESLERVEAG